MWVYLRNLIVSSDLSIEQYLRQSKPSYAWQSFEAIDISKSIKEYKFVSGCQPNFGFAVKFYEPLPSQIKTDYTR